MAKTRQITGARHLLFLTAGLLLFGTVLTAEIRLPAVLGDHMVLQQDKPIKVWGWAEPGEGISVKLGDQSAQTTVDKDGIWEIVLEAMTAAKNPHKMTISGTQSRAVELEDILIGEVWVCSGQSNMEWEMWQTHSPTPEIRRADYPSIRLFHVPRKASPYPLDDVEAEWKLCSPETARDFSAVAYYFGLELHRELDVPIGLISTRWGGTRIEPWTPAAGFRSVPEVSDILAEMKASDDEHRNALKGFLPELRKWIERSDSALSGGEVLPVPPDIPLHPLQNPQAPTALYNAMVHPLIRFAIRGAIWYQGEANRNDGLIYAKKMEALIKGWRTVWGLGDFPFYYVQLAPYNYGYIVDDEESDALDFDRLPLIWEAQRQALKIPNTGMAVTTDITNLYDIQPKNKKEVGYRLSLCPWALTYGKKDLVYSGPLYKSMTIEGDKIRLRFDHVGSGLISLDDRPLTWFAIAGEDHIFYKARAEIDGDSVLVWCEKVPAPTAVRLGWHQLATPNIGNREGLPASPFRTDRW